MGDGTEVYKAICHGVARGDAGKTGRGLIMNALGWHTKECRTSLVAQWFRVRLPMLGTRVQSLVREDPTCHGATKPVRHNY